MRRTSTILVVDDEEDIRRLLGFVLTRAGYEALLAADGREGLGVLCSRSGCISAVVTDLDMPGMGGIEFSVQILTGLPHVPVIHMTGSDRTAPPIPSIPLLAKPFPMRELIDLVDATVRSGDGEGELATDSRSGLAMVRPRCDE